MYIVQCVTNFGLLLLVRLCFSFLFVLCESSSKPEIARNVWFDFFCWSVLISPFSLSFSLSVFVVFSFAFGCCQMNYLRTHCVCLRFMLRPSSYWISLGFFFQTFFSLCFDTHWWNTVVDACCQWHGHNRKKYSLVNCLLCEWMNASARFQCVCGRVPCENVVLCYFQFYLYNIGLNMTTNGTI